MKQNNTAISVGLAERSYDIHIGSGLIDNADTYAAPFTADRHLVIITDDNVGAAHGERIKAGLVNFAPVGQARKASCRPLPTCKSGGTGFVD